MSSRHHRRLTAWLVAATTALGLLAAAPAAQAVGSPTALNVWPHCAPDNVAVDVEADATDVSWQYVTFLLDGTVVGSGENDGYGDVAATLHIPSHTAGTYTVEMWSAGEGTSQQLATATFRVPCFSVTATPSPVALRDGPLTLQLRADGYDYPHNYDYPTYPVVFQLDGHDIATADQDTAGHVSTTVQLPAVPDCDSHLITADYARPRVGSSEGDPEATAAQTALVVTCPTLTPHPPSVAQSVLPTGIQVSGDGWDGGSNVALSIDGAVVATTTADKVGRLTTTVPLASRPCGNVSMVGAEVPPPGAAAPLRVPQVTTSVDVTCLPPTPPTPPKGPAPTLVADPVVSSGGVALASGQGFTPGATVRLAWVLPDATNAPGGAMTTVAAADGSITVSCLVLAHARLGPRTLRAEQDGAAASAPVLVVNGPMEPGRNRLLGRR